MNHDNRFLKNWVDRKPEEIQARFTINEGWTNKPITKNVVPDIYDFKDSGSKQRVDLPASNNPVYFMVIYFDGAFHVQGNPDPINIKGINRVLVSVSGLKRNYYKEEGFRFDNEDNCWKFISEDGELRKRYKDRVKAKTQEEGVTKRTDISHFNSQ